MDNTFVYGIDSTPGVVSCEVDHRTSELIIYRESAGEVIRETRAYSHWALAPEAYSSQWSPLDGANHYRFIREFSSRRQMLDTKSRHRDLWLIYDAREAALVRHGITYFKDSRIQDISVLSFDIESTSIDHTPDARVLLISNTYRCGARVERRLFKYSDYESDAAMFDDWCEWVRRLNPSLLVGHNLFGYDIPFMNYCARKAGTELRLGRDGSALFIPEYESRYRRDGSQDYTYRNARVHGREIIDTMFLAIKYDIGRKYESFALKKIIAAEGLEVEGRQHYDASLIARNYRDPNEWQKICAYAEHDADDSLALFDLMAPSYFYLNQSIPKPFQTLINGASGAWLNSFLVRAYLSENHSIPAPSEAAPYEGAISIGNPGVYRNVYKVDAASLYPSIMMTYKIEDKTKDPLGKFQAMVTHFTNERLANKQKAKETGDRYYTDLEQAQKVFINSAYGLLGVPGLHFNSPTGAARVTELGREILQRVINWSQSKGFQLVNADTDSVSITLNGAAMSEDIRTNILVCINNLMPAGIRWEDDGYYPSVVVFRAKNYSLYDGKTIKNKGSALKASLKELALIEFIERSVRILHGIE